MPNIVTQRKVFVLGVLNGASTAARIQLHRQSSGTHQLLQNGFLEVKGAQNPMPESPRTTTANTLSLFLLLAMESWRRRDCEAKILSPHCAVEFNKRLVDLAITAEDKDVDALNWCSTWV